MRRRFAISLFCFAALVSTPVVADMLRASASTAWGMPVGEIDADGQLSRGIMRDLYSELGREMGVAIQVVPLPRKRVDMAVANGEIDLRCYLNRNWVGNPEQYRWSGPIFTVQDLIVARAGISSPSSLADLHGKSLGTVLGYVYPDKLQSLFGKQVFREDAPTPSQALSKLQLGRSNYAVVDHLALGWHVKQQGVRFAANPLVLHSYDIECAVPQQAGPAGDAALVALEKLRKRGTIAAILARYQPSR